jgi:P27 family predicted phage terminase small subunit
MAGVKGRSGGWNRRSVEEHVARGTYRPERHGALALPLVNSGSELSTTAEAPASLSLERRADWHNYLKAYEGWTVAELVLLKLALEAQDRAEQCRRRIKREGLTLRGRRGRVQAHPLLRVEKAAVAVMLDAFKQLGLGGRTP